MECKTEPFVSSAGDYFDIPAAEQEITVSSNEQISTPSSNSLVQNIVTIPPSSASQTTTTPVFRMACPPQVRGPRVIMVQRSGQPMISSPIGAHPPQGLKAVKIITVPGQGAGGKPLKAAVIPMQMLQRGVKVLTSLGQQAIGSGVPIHSSGGVPTQVGMPRFLTFRPAGQVGVQSSGQLTLIGGPGGHIRPGTFIVSASGDGGLTNRVTPSFAMHQPGRENIENMIIGSGGDANYLQGQPMTQGGGFFELSASHPHAHFARQGSPTMRDSDGEQDYVTTGLKTNGLRRYARCVCNKVKEKGITSYSEVADELVHEYAAEHPMIPSEQLHYIQKNIRRRVYDALNVLMALNVLQKEKKEIRWVGLPVNMIEECRRLEEEREKRQISLRNKTAEIQELILQLIAFKNLIVRNRINERYKKQRQVQREATAAAAASAALNENGTPDSDLNPTRPNLSLDLTVAALSTHKMDTIQLPFLVISASKKAVIDCNISNNKLEYIFSFDQAFEIRDEIDILKRMGLTLRLGSAQCTQDEYNQCLELIPPSLRFYVEAIFERRQAIVPDFEALHQQRRLFIEARLAEAATAGNAGDLSHESADGLSGAEHLKSQALSHPHRLHKTSPHAHSGGDMEDSFGFYDSGVIEDTGVRHIQLQRSGPGVIQSDLVPGDTQHYAHTAAARGFVVPGGPDGLLRHRSVMPASHFRGQAGKIHIQAVKMTVEGNRNNATVLGDAENTSATAAISSELRLRSHDLMDDDDCLPDDDDDDEDLPDDEDDDVDMGDDDDDEDDEMEDVNDVLKPSP